MLCQATFHETDARQRCARCGLEVCEAHLPEPCGDSHLPADSLLRRLPREVAPTLPGLEG